MQLREELVTQAHRWTQLIINNIHTSNPEMVAGFHILAHSYDTSKASLKDKRTRISPEFPKLISIWKVCKALLIGCTAHCLHQKL
jgi:hypothetical protein